MAILQIESDDCHGHVLPLNGDSITLGRNAALGDIFSRDLSVSRLHARITRVSEEYSIEDLGSRHGTFVNGRPVTGPQPLHDGDRIQIATYRLLFLLDPTDIDSDSVAADPTRMSVILDLGEPSVESAVDVADNSETSAGDNTLKALLRMLGRLKAARKPNEILQGLLQSLLQAFPTAQRGYIGTMQGDELVSRAVTFRGPHQHNVVPVSRQLAKMAIRDRKAIMFRDALHTTNLNPDESISQYDIRSVMCVPFYDEEGMPLGIIQLDSPIPGDQFREEDLRLLANLAPQAAFVLAFDQLQQQAVAKREIDSDLEVARRVQESLMPAEPPSVANYEFYSFYRAARLLGGDFYTYIPMPDGRLAIILADVAGKGIAAALYVARLSGELRHLIRSGESPADVINLLNDSFVTDAEQRFVTFVLLVLDSTKHELTVVNAGHWDPVLRTKKGKLVNLTSNERGLPIGILEDQKYHAFQRRLESGDAVVVFTDGFVDAENEQEEQYGDDRLYEQLKLPATSAAELGQNVVTSVLDHLGSAKQADDLSLVCLRRI
jgi:serine phosphatase RsbU (regulator of sigma subunit)